MSIPGPALGAIPPEVAELVAILSNHPCENCLKVLGLMKTASPALAEVMDPPEPEDPDDPDYLELRAKGHKAHGTPKVKMIPGVGIGPRVKERVLSAIKRIGFELRCAVTHERMLPNKSVAFCHVVARVWATDAYKKKFQNLECALGCWPDELNLHTRLNIIPMRYDLHKSFDSRVWFFLLEDVMLFEIRNFYRQEKRKGGNRTYYLDAFPTPKDGWEYFVFGLTWDRTVKIFRHHTSRLSGVLTNYNWFNPILPMSRRDSVRSHIHPAFAIANAGEKLLKLSPSQREALIPLEFRDSIDAIIEIYQYFIADPPAGWSKRTRQPRPSRPPAIPDEEELGETDDEDGEEADIPGVALRQTSPLEQQSTGSRRNLTDLHMDFHPSPEPELSLYASAQERLAQPLFSPGPHLGGDDEVDLFGISTSDLDGGSIGTRSGKASVPPSSSTGSQQQSSTRSDTNKRKRDLSRSGAVGSPNPRSSPPRASSSKGRIPAQPALPKERQSIGPANLPASSSAPPRIRGSIPKPPIASATGSASRTRVPPQTSTHATMGPPPSPPRNPPRRTSSVASSSSAGSSSKPSIVRSMKPRRPSDSSVRSNDTPSMGGASDGSPQGSPTKKTRRGVDSEKMKERGG